jgi:Predicted 3'-5' exonuclease related to the exonuclease domain of PolB
MKATRLVLDIETCSASPEDISAAAERYKPPANIKDPAKRAARQGEATEKLIERAALLDSSPIITIAAKTEHQAVLFNGMSTDTFPVDSWTVLPCGDEKTMLWAFGQWVAAVCDEGTTLVGHNIMRFDLPRVRGRLLWYRLPLPACLDPGQSVFDTMKAFRFYSSENYDEIFTSLDTICATFGLPRKKPLLNGSDVPRLYREGKYATIVQYNALDAALTEACYLLMAGQG